MRVDGAFMEMGFTCSPLHRHRGWKKNEWLDVSGEEKTRESEAKHQRNLLGIPGGLAHVL